MIIVDTVAALREALEPHRWRGQPIGLVPTMGALHRGHLELLRRARRDNDVVVLSVFVNPAQFDDPADLAAYPRTDSRDRELAESAGVSIYFAPQVVEVYPPAFSATVALAGPLVETFEGAHRGAQHFHGVTTVVTKLLLMAQPDHAYFGEKDAQQLKVVRALVDDLNIPARIVSVPTVREEDGLALSSRNVRLDAADRDRALGLSRALFVGLDDFRSGERTSAHLVADAGKVLADHAIVPEYLEVVDAETFRPVELVPATGAVLILAATVGLTRLIDNVRLVDAGIKDH